jgi:GNAT superfamily N-acetyltransferase
MTVAVTLVPPEETLALRELHREEMGCQIILDSWHGRGWVDSYLLRIDGRIAGYGLVGGVRDEPRETVTEFYILPVYRAVALPLFRRLAEESRARRVEAQSNDILLTLMLYDCVEEIQSHVVLFQDGLTTSLSVPGAAFREAVEIDKERLGARGLDTDARWLVESDGAIVAVGGLLFHYNAPYGDIFMEVAEPHRRRGLGSYLVQELKRVAYEMGKIPAARCNASNTASRATLQKAGMLPCARMLAGPLKIG